MLALLLLACSPKPDAATPPSSEIVVPPPTATAPAVLPDGVPVAGTMRQGGTPPARIYVSMVSHNEERPNLQCTPILTDPAEYARNRSMVVKMANTIAQRGAAWDMQNEWEFLEAVKKWDTTTLKAETNGKNLIEYVGTLSPSHLVVDAHSHEKTYNYADIIGMIRDLGAPTTGVVGGFIYYPRESEVWTRLKSDLAGARKPSLKWTPEILWGAGTFQHGGPDMRASGIWRPKSVDAFTTDDPSSRLVYVGNYQYTPEHDFTGVKELVSRLKAGELQAGHLYTATVFFRQCELDDAMISAVAAEIDALKPEVDAGNLVWAPIPEMVRVWRTEYGSVPTYLEPLNEAPRTGLGGKGGGGKKPPGMGPGGKGPPPGGGTRPPKGGGGGLKGGDRPPLGGG